MITDTEVVDRISAWLCYPARDGQWRSACDFIEFAAELVERSGRSADPVLPADECPVTDDGRHCSCWYDDNLPCCVCGLTNGGSE